VRGADAVASIVSPSSEDFFALLTRSLAILRSLPLSSSGAAFHAKVDNMGPAFLLAKTKTGSYFGAFNPLGWASREDYRDAFNAFLVKWPNCAAPGDASSSAAPFILEKVGGPGAAIFDFGAEGPIFGADALKIPLGRAPSMGSSYAAIGGEALSGGGKVIVYLALSFQSSLANQSRFRRPDPTATPPFIVRTTDRR
jgi:hypothetical protein